MQELLTLINVRLFVCFYEMYDISRSTPLLFSTTIGVNEASNATCTDPDLVYETIDKYDPNGLPFKQSPYDFKTGVPTNTSLPVIIEETKQDFSVKMEMQEGHVSSSSDDPYTVMNPAQVATVFPKNEHS